MTQKANKREVYAPEKKDSIVNAKETGKPYPVDILKEVYIKTDKTLEQLSKEYNLPIGILQRYARTGLSDWEKLRAEYQMQRFEAFLKAREDSLMETQSAVQRLETLHLMSLHLKMAEIEEHFKTHGDFFVRDSEGEIMRNGFGQPIELFLPSTKALGVLKSLAELREVNGQLLQTAIENQSKKQKTIETGVLAGHEALFEKKDG